MSGVLVTVQEESLSGITSEDGTYFIQDVPSGRFTLVAQKPGCLVAVRSDVVIAGGSAVVNFQMIPGDLKMDNQINLLDRLMLTRAWGAREADPNWDNMLDIHEDGVIDERDRELLLSHWRKGTSSIKLGSLTVSSEPSEASILINGADTGKTTPHHFPGVVVSTYNITLIREDYAPGKIAVQVKEEETATVDLILDDQPPEFVDWTQDPEDLTEDTLGKLRVSVQIVDKGGSGLEGKIPQFDYHIGAGSTYSGYKNMVKETGDLWYYEIDEPVESWDAYRDKYVYYKVKAQDVAGNEIESAENQELIDDINDLPIVEITSRFNVWESGLLTIEADASDSDGKIEDVRFQYSFDNARWTQIGSRDTTSPYSVAWETTEAVREVVKNVWIKATATDDDDQSDEDIIQTTFGIDNQPPITSHDYDGSWYKENFTINLEATDEDGIGVSRIAYRLNNGNKQEITTEDVLTIASVNIAKEGSENILEYWSVDKLGNEESHNTLSKIRLDKTVPMFSNWEQDPADLTEDSVGRFRVSVRVTDEDGSGLEDKIPQIDYHIGTNTQYDGYEDMVTEDGRVWYFDIPEPIDSWNVHRGGFVYYKARSEDVAGNTGESIERRELIDDVNDPPVVHITSRFNKWEKGTLTIEAEGSDTDGQITEVQFEYSFDKNVWTPIGPPDSTPPFSVGWDTTLLTQQTQTVWIQATATDDGGATVTDLYATSIGIDNQPPVTSHDYDGSWRTEDFAIVMKVSDGNGVGVSSNNVKYILNDGNEKTLATDGHPWISEEGINQLEYWSVDDLGNAEDHHKLINIKLDKTGPVFVDWNQDPLNLTEDSRGFFRVLVRVMDAGGSGFDGKIPQFSYRIGRSTQYSEYEDMTKETDDVWYYDIPEPDPIESWNAYRGQAIYYKVKAQDIAGNPGESTEREEMIDDINDAPEVSITTQFSTWESGAISIEAESSDPDGQIKGVQFEYSFNQVAWTAIGSTITMPPYSVTWDTKTSVPEVKQTVWLKATAFDDDGDLEEYITSKSFRIDNQAPVVSDDYDELWHRRDFFINLTANDRDGVGVASISYRLNSGDVENIPITGQASIQVNITTEGSGNILEYWSTDGLGNESSHQTLTDIKLDKTAPEFSNWAQHPENLTEDTTLERLRVSVQATDKGGSGLTGKIPQLDYHIGVETSYDGYENMKSDDGVTWYFDIPEPAEQWNAYRGKNIYYKARLEDIAGNVAESLEEWEPIDSLNDPPTVSIVSTFQEWEGGQIAVEATASDIDASVPIVQFDYSLDATNWTPISVAISAPPYSVVWDTTTIIPQSEQAVWIRATAIDADDNTVSEEDIIPTSFGIDNQPATFGDWTTSPENLTEDTRGSFRVYVNVDDGLGSGVAKVELAHRIDNIYHRAFAEMRRGTGNSWYYDIPEPSGTWDKYRGKTLYYNAKATDLVDNETPVTAEQSELIEDINDAPRGLITSTYKEWEQGTLSIFANATDDGDDDGQVTSVQFQYSTDNVNWINIGAARTRAPYTVTWDTTTISSAPEVWLRIVITDNKNATAEATIAQSFGIDNKPPVYANWSHTSLTEDFEDIFRVEVQITDEDSGIDSTKVQLDYRIGLTGYTGYRSMFKETGGKWFYEIPRPTGNWSNYAGETLFYRVRAYDKAGNFAESDERKEFIDPTTGSISGTVTPKISSVRIVAQQNGVDVKPPVSVSLSTGKYSIIGLRPGFYDLVVTATGYGTDRSLTNIEVKAGEESTGHNVVLHTYAVVDINRAQGGVVEFTDSSLKEYRLVVDSGTLDGKVILGFSGIEPTTIPNPEVHLGQAIGVGFQGRSISKPLQLIMPRPSTFTANVDSKSIMTFIYDGDDYAFVDRSVSSGYSTSSTVTINIDPDDVKNFSDRNHKFDDALSQTSDTVFYALITRFDEPQISVSSLGIRNPLSSSSQVSISSTDRRVALIVPGITSDSDDFSNLISNLNSMLDAAGQKYYDKVLVFNYNAGSPVESSSDLFLDEVQDLVPSTFVGKIDVVAHGMGALIVRAAVNAGADAYIGSLTMLGAPNGGVDESLLKAGFGEFLNQTPSDTAWSYYRDGWQDIIEGASFLSSLNNQSARIVNTHYYGIAAAWDTDGLVSLGSANFTDNNRFPFLEQPLTEMFQGIPVTPPSSLSAGTGFMPRTRHVAMVKSVDVINRITEYLLGHSADVVYEKYDGDLIPGQRIEEFTVYLKNVGSEKVYGVSAKLSTQNAYIRKYSGAQGIEVDTATFGDIDTGDMSTGIFSFDVSSTAASVFGSPVTFTLLIRNSEDNSISVEEFTATIGGNMIQIALDQNDNKRVGIDIAEDTDRPDNDGDVAVEPGEIMGLNIMLENAMGSSLSAVTGILKTTDTRVTGLIPEPGTPSAGWDTVDMANDGIQVSYGSIFGGSTKSAPFQFVRIDDNFSPLGDEIHFTLDIKSGANFIGSDEFDVMVGAAIVMEDFEVDDRLVPGGDPEEITVRLRNITGEYINDVRIELDVDDRDIDIDDDRKDIDQFRTSETLDFVTTIEPDFSGYAQFTLTIEVEGTTINVESSSALRYYFGMRTHYMNHWVVDDDDRDDIPEPGESIELQVARRNPTDEEARDVEVEIALTTPDDAIDIRDDDARYVDISAHEVAELSSSQVYELDIANAGDMSYSASSSDSILDATTLRQPGATWIPDAFIGGTLNPNTDQPDPAVVYEIIGNDTDTITVDLDGKPDMNTIAADGDPFEIIVEGPPFNDFEVAGHPVDFTLRIYEDSSDPLGEEIITFWIGGVIRYMQPQGYDDLLDTLSDKTSLSVSNDGDGIPEPGEIIEMDITLKNVTDKFEVDNVEAELDADESNIDIDDDQMDYETIRYRRDETRTFQFEIEPDFTGDKITFELRITGDITRYDDSNLGSGDEVNNADLGTYRFVIPVGNSQ